MNGQYRSLYYCVISGKNEYGYFHKVLSSSGADVDCEVVESFEFGIRIIGTVACDSTPCPGSNNAFNMSWNGTQFFFRAHARVVFILDMDWNGTFAQISTIDAKGGATQLIVRCQQFLMQQYLPTTPDIFVDEP